MCCLKTSVQQVSAVTDGPGDALHWAQTLLLVFFSNRPQVEAMDFEQ